MKKIALLVALALASGVVMADTYVPGYFRSDGTYVPGHYRSSPNNSMFDNYSSKPNINPYTGERGAVDPYKLKPAPGFDSYGNYKSAPMAPTPNPYYTPYSYPYGYRY